MWSDLVGERGELVEVFLQRGERVRGMLGEEAFQRLPESFDLALRGGFVGAPVLLGDAFQFEERFEAIEAGLEAASGEPGGVDHAVVGER